MVFVIRLLEPNYVDIEQPHEFRRPKWGHAHGAGGRAATEPAEFGETQQKNAPQVARQMVTSFGPIETPARDSGLSRFKCVNVDRDPFQPMFAGGSDGIPFRGLIRDDQVPSSFGLRRDSNAEAPGEMVIAGTREPQ